MIGSVIPSPAPNPWAKVGLAGAQVTGQQDHVAGQAQAGPGPRPAARVWSAEAVTSSSTAVGRPRRPASGSAADGAVTRSIPSSCLARTRSARISATTTPPDRRAAAGW